LDGTPRIGFFLRCQTLPVAGSVPLARLSKDKTWVICARIDCGEQFARRIEHRSDPLMGRLDPAFTQVPWPKASLEFGGGWFRRGEVWSMSKRAWRRKAEGLPPAFRRSPNAEDEKLGKDRWGPKYRDRSDHPGALTQIPSNLPARIVCPRCGLQQIADPIVLECR
jgi:hypothetical protein